MTWRIEFSGHVDVEASSREEALQKYDMGEFKNSEVDDIEIGPDKVYLVDDGGYEE